ncbi:hypothetical protein BABINDRAFT_163042 [Babjeviella inositovora NRRL Y-12698]|uniref:Ribonuclease P/MRP protein subunit POP5 n=1 Tax=Babjeviella inositovora NRRL Y-12698 TaxID=984486 RepID=A0A1E3QLN7_9ASCO|nr:uncharacterized protein BABINDRAFT_163042 [Babjeviella inositovora NRRL Y-12698]ODQ77992.1 hypothetical protein BABINDRAFT_163042 [Babjeviella inositovora NRRL Y-12698]
MVRLKTRYILFDILYPDSMSPGYASQRDAMLVLHQPSPQNINQKILINTLRGIIQEFFGDFGAGTSGISLTLKYFSNKTSTGIIRVGRSAYRIVCAALMMINRLHDNDVVMRVARVSGTIKKCENYAIKRNNEMTRLLRGGEADDNRFRDDVMGITDDEMNDE